MITLILVLPSPLRGLQYERAHKTIAEDRGMRVTLETKTATRQRILEAARRLFISNGFETATTRDIAHAAGIASGTLFNYFPTKEAVLASLVAEAAAGVEADFFNATPQGSLEEDLFAFVAAGLRKLKPLRKHLPVLLETVLSPLAQDSGEEIQSLRMAQLESVARLAKRHDLEELSSVAIQLYWTLYTGVLMFWANDRSPKHEDTLALLDNSLAMFVGWLQKENEAEMKGGVD
jgi:AcrR family transcriptional regulator